MSILKVRNSASDPWQEVPTISSKGDMRKLWTNPSPSAAFAAQTLNIDVSVYDAILITWAQKAGNSGVWDGPLIPVDSYTHAQTTMSMPPSGACIDGSRNVTAGSNIVFGDALYKEVPSGTRATDNTYMVPLVIYGANISSKYNVMKQLMLDMMYPVGTYYWSANNTDPGTLFGGTWTQVKDKFILAAGDTYTAGATGGEAAHTLSEAEIPSHRHADLYVGSARVGWRSSIGASGTGSAMAAWATGASIFYTGYTGSGDSHNNMPPYEVAYCWKRTA